MLRMLFLGMLEASNAYYGDSIGLAPIALGSPVKPYVDENIEIEESWSNDFDR